MGGRLFLEVYREYDGSFEKVGSFSYGESERLEFSYSEAYLQLPYAQPLSVSLPLQTETYHSDDYQAFFEGLVPEGRVRTELARSFHLSPSDYLGVLKRLNCECVGALLFKDPNVAIEAYAPSYRRIEADECAALAVSPVVQAARLTETSRLSLAGAQSKVGVYLHGGSLFAPEGTAPSTHILKLPDYGHEKLPANEVFCHRLARACGLEVSECEVFSLPNGDQALLSRRYDRPIDESSRGEIDGMPCPYRLHQEDMCQAAGLPAYRKYELDPTDCYPLVINNLIQRHSSNPLRDKIEFARQVVFDYLIGNCDNHLKNYSFLLSPSWRSRRLAPAYDLVCTTVLGYSREMGISVGDTREIDKMTASDWGLFAGDLKVSEKALLHEISIICARFAERGKSIAEAVDAECGNSAASEITADAQGRLKVLTEASAG